MQHPPRPPLWRQLKSLWGIRHIRANRIVQPLFWKAMRIWGASPLDRDEIYRFARDAYPKEMDEAEAVMRERIDLGFHGIHLWMPDRPCRRSIELQVVLDLGWHGFYITTGFDAMNHLVRVGLGIGSVRLQYLCPFPIRQLTGSGPIDIGDLKAAPAVYNPHNLVVPPPPSFGGIAVVCNRCQQICPVPAASPMEANQIAVSMGWKMQTVKALVCPDCDDTRKDEPDGQQNPEHH